MPCDSEHAVISIRDEKTAPGVPRHAMRHQVAPSPCSSKLEASYARIDGPLSRDNRSVYYRYPRGSYAIVILLISFVLGHTSSLAISLWGLEAFNVPARLVHARKLANPVDFYRLKEMTSCEYVRRPLVLDFPDLDKQLNAAKLYAQKQADANDDAIALAINVSSRCHNSLVRMTKTLLEGLVRSRQKHTRQELAGMQSCMVTLFDQLIGNFSLSNTQTRSTNSPKSSSTTSQIFLASALASSLAHQTTSALYNASRGFGFQQLQTQSLLATRLPEHEITSLRNSTTQKLTNMIKMLEPTARVARRLSGADELKQLLTSISDAALRVTGNVNLPEQGIEQEMAALSSVADVNVSKLNEKLRYFTDFVLYQLQVTQVELKEEFQRSQAKVETTIQNLEELWKEMLPIFTEADTMEYWTSDRKASAGVGDGELTFLGTFRTTHVLGNQPNASSRSGGTNSSVSLSSGTIGPKLSMLRKNSQGIAANSTTPDDAAPDVYQRWSFPTFQDIQSSGSVLDWIGDAWLFMFGVHAAQCVIATVEMVAMIITGVIFTSDVIDTRDFGQIKLVVRITSLINDADSIINRVNLRPQDDVWDLLFGRATFSGILYSIALQGREVVRALARIALTAITSVAATIALMFMKFEHNSSCSQKGTLADLSKWKEGSPPGFTKSTFMRLWLPNFEIDQSILSSSNHQAVAMDDHANAMFDVLQTEVNAVWADQNGLQDILSTFSELTGAAVLELDTCGKDFSALLLPNDVEKQQCVLAGTLATASLPTPTPPNVSAVAAPISWSSNPEFVDLSHLNGSSVCPPLTSEDLATRGATLYSLEARYLCGAEESLYLVFSSWLLLLFVVLLVNMINEMLVEAINMVWWQFYTNDRFSFVGFCTRDGNVQPPQDLTEKIEIYMSNIWWRIGARVAAVTVSVTGVVIVWFVLLS